LLVCDEFKQEISNKYGQYYDMFKNVLLVGGLIEFSLIPIDVKNDVNNFPNNADLKSFDAFIITGSKYSVYDDFEWIRRLEKNIRILDSLKN